MTVNFSLKGNVIIVGGYGGGKTEITINLALFMKGKGLQVRVADLDVVNLYFRTREAQLLFKKSHIPCILPEKSYHHSDFPALSPKIGALFRRQDGLTIFDCGGDPVGALVLGALKEAAGCAPLQMLYVINPFRPDSGSVEEVRVMKEGIEKHSGFLITGIVGNAHLMEATRLDDILFGYQFVHDFAEKEGLDLIFVTAPKALAGKVEKKRIACPVLPITRRLLPPWRRT